MDWIIPTVATGAATAIATTFENNIYLTMFFSKTNRTFRPRHVVVGEVIGFTGLIAISLLSFLAGLMIDHMWIGLLVFLPIAIGVNALTCQSSDDDDDMLRGDGLWLALSYSLIRQPQAAFVMARYVRRAFPFVLI